MQPLPWRLLSKKLKERALHCSGCVFALMPALITDAFGQKHAAANFGCLYLAKAAGAVLSGPAAAWARESTGDWSAVLLGLALASAAAAAITRLKIAPELPRVRARVQAQQQSIA